jgi:hypothetical protein
MSPGVAGYEAADRVQLSRDGDIGELHSGVGWGGIFSNGFNRKTV